MTRILAPFARIPAPLVIIVLIAAIVAIGAGLVLRQAREGRVAGDDFLTLRLAPGADGGTLTENALVDSWGLQNKVAGIGIRFRNGVYEWIMARGDLPGVRFYSRGSYRVAGDVLILQPRDDMGMPPEAADGGARYLPLAMTGINTRARIVGGTLLIAIPATELARQPKEFADMIDGLDTDNLDFKRLSPRGF